MIAGEPGVLALELVEQLRTRFAVAHGHAHRLGELDRALRRRLTDADAAQRREEPVLVDARIGLRRRDQRDRRRDAHTQQQPHDPGSSHAATTEPPTAELLEGKHIRPSRGAGQALES